MTFDEYQEKALETAIYPEAYRMIYPALGLAGEAGEVANKVKKIVRDDVGRLTESRRNEIGKEIGGVLWYIAALCTDIGVTIEEVAVENIDILQSRKVRGVISGDGDNR